MLFNSYAFAFYFLPVAVIGFFAFARLGGPRAAAVWLALVSVAFYGYWTPRYIPLLVGSVVGNYALARIIQRINARQRRAARISASLLLGIAISANLALLFYYKYANFFLANLSALVGREPPLLAIVLPIGISFFTFTQIAYLVDTYQGKVEHTDPWHYLLFVTFFPHLIAGPILHHSEMMPQFGERSTYAMQLDRFAIGLVIFFIGLAKKVVLADGIQPFVASTFDGSVTKMPSLLGAWGGALAYTLQLYFDFSGYSDMAIGLALLFNINLPINFNSPYKAQNIADFWRRWHMTLSRFLRDYLYIPLGGNRLGGVRRYANLIVTMLLGGLWHGAAWTFVVWGALHGFYLCVYHGWTAMRLRLGFDQRAPSRAGRVAGVAITFFCVVLGWVYFRAESLGEAHAIIRGMIGLNGVAVPQLWGDADIVKRAISWGLVTLAPAGQLNESRQLIWITALLAVAFFLPNTQTIVARPGFSPVTRTPARPVLLLAIGVLLPLLLLLLMINGSRGVSEFIYFNF